MNRSGRVLLASDATRALLFESSKHHAEILKLLEEAETEGLNPIYNALVFTIFDYEFLKAGKAENRKRLAEFMAKLEATSFLAVPNEEDIVSGFAVYEKESQHQTVPYVDLIGITMSARLDASFLTLDHHSNTLWVLYRANKLINEVTNRADPSVGRKKEDVPM